jgi:hypothetical protein
MSEKKRRANQLNDRLKERGLDRYMTVEYVEDTDTIRFTLDAPINEAHECMHVLKEWEKKYE